MKRNFERRRCHRFEIPDAHVSYQKSGLWKMISDLSDPSELVNISKGGLSFKTNGNINPGDKITIYLYLSHGTCLPIKGTVAWKDGTDNSEISVGVKFAAYKKGYGNNPLETLDSLRYLESIYLQDRNELRRVA